VIVEILVILLILAISVILAVLAIVVILRYLQVFLRNWLGMLEVARFCSEAI